MSQEEFFQERAWLRSRLRGARSMVAPDGNAAEVKEKLTAHTVEIGEPVTAAVKDRITTPSKSGSSNAQMASNSNLPLGVLCLSAGNLLPLLGRRRNLRRGRIVLWSQPKRDQRK